MRTCSKCGMPKPIEAFGADVGKRCRVCRTAAVMAWRNANLERARAHVRAYHHSKKRARRKAILDAYGGKCACCGETTQEFLAVDHILGGGNRHLREIGARSITQWLRKNKFPPGFRVLCHNCNMARGAHGVCPHDVVRLELPFAVNMEA